LSRRRELLADAGSVELTKNPDALISALMKISQNPSIPHVPSEVRQMFIENPPSSFSLFDTHPPIAQRIHVLEQLGGHLPTEQLSAPGPASAPVEPGPWGAPTASTPPAEDPGPWGPHGGAPN